MGNPTITPGMGGFRLVPTAPSANGLELLGKPMVCNGVRIELAASATITYYFAASGITPTTAPTLVKTTTAPASTAIYVDEPLAGDDSVFVTSCTGQVIFRWVLAGRA